MGTGPRDWLDQPELNLSQEALRGTLNQINSVSKEEMGAGCLLGRPRGVSAGPLLGSSLTKLQLPGDCTLIAVLFLKAKI